MGEVLLEADHLRRRFGGRLVVDDVCFQARAGEVLGLLGPNGAGKTTTLRMLAGLLAPSDGRVLLCGRDLAAEPASARQIVGYLPEQAGVYEEMTVTGYLRFLASAWGVGRGSVRDAAARSMEEVGVADVARRVIGTLSRGYRQRVALAGALVHDPSVVLLDEPTTALDPRQIVDIRNLLASLARTRLVVLSTHQLNEAAKLCDRALVIHRGRQVALDRVERLRLEASGRLQLTVGAPGEEALRSISGLHDVKILHVEETEGRTRMILSAEAGGDPRPVIAVAVVAAGLDLLELRQAGTELEDAFLSLTG